MRLSKKAVHVAALMTLVSGLAACGSDTADRTSWDAVDPCTLADEATLTPLLAEAPGTGMPAEDPDRKACTWGEQSTLNVVTVTLTAEPMASEPLRTLDVSGQTGRVLAESKYQCIVEFDGAAGTLTLESKFGLDAVVNPDTSCDRSTALAEHALTQLGWA